MQNIFSKMDKKVLVIVGVILIVVLISSFFVYRYLKDLEKTVQNNEGEVKIKTPGEQIIIPDENSQNQDQPNNIPQVQLQPQGSLIVCADKCGDGICQPVGTICDDNLNCVCSETKEDCPSDCK